MSAVCWMVALAVWAGSDVDGADRLTGAYPSFLAAPERENTVRWKDGSVMVYDDGVEEPTFDERLNTASLADQMSIPYPAGWPVEAPEVDEDPGRLRYEPFFRKMYGDSKEEVGQRLKAVPWKPSGGMVQFTTANGAADALQAVGDEIALEPAEVRRYVAKSLGTFVWRPIAKTGRLSMHSFGAAIDFELPLGVTTYWLWEEKKRGAYRYPESVLKDEKLGRIVEIFEKHGFIWGGKWYHYDLMHFEYRPELLPRAGAAE